MATALAKWWPLEMKIWRRFHDENSNTNNTQYLQRFVAISFFMFAVSKMMFACCFLLVHYFVVLSLSLSHQKCNDYLNSRTMPANTNSHTKYIHLIITSSALPSQNLWLTDTREVNFRPTTTALSFAPFPFCWRAGNNKQWVYSVSGQETAETDSSPSQCPPDSRSVMKKNTGRRWSLAEDLSFIPLQSRGRSSGQAGASVKGQTWGYIFSSCVTRPEL